MRSPRCRAGRQDAIHDAPLPWRRKIASDRGRTTLLICALASVASSAAPAAAQWGGSLSLSSQARLRGQPISDRRPVAEVELVHDSDSGFYFGGSAAIVDSRDAGIQPFSFKQYAGFVRRLSSGAALDAGVVHNGYTEYSGISGGGSYTEAYVGLTGRNLSGRLFLSPGYFSKDQPTLYVEVDGHADLSRSWSLFAHAGRLVHLRDYHGAGNASGATDWRVGLRRRLGPIDLEGAWTGYAETARPYRRYGRSDGALVIGLIAAF